MTRQDLIAECDALGIGPEELAAYTGLHRATIYRWFKDGPPASRVTLVKRILAGIVPVTGKRRRDRAASRA